MNLDVVMADLEKGFQNPDVVIRKSVIPSEDMPKYKLRRSFEAPEYRVWVISVGEAGQQPAYFVDLSLNRALRKAMAWRGIKPSSRKKTAPDSAGQATA